MLSSLLYSVTEMNFSLGLVYIKNLCTFLTVLCVLYINILKILALITLTVLCQEVSHYKISP
jgi:hypothetical protein